MRESKIEKELTEWVKLAGGQAYKLVSPGNNGMPDRLVIFPDRAPIFVELKAEKGVLSAMQKRQIDKLTQLGQRAVVLYGIDGVSQFFRDEGLDGISDAIDGKYDLKYDL